MILPSLDYTYNVNMNFNFPELEQYNSYSRYIYPSILFINIDRTIYYGGISYNDPLSGKYYYLKNLEVKKVDIYIDGLLVIRVIKTP